MDSLPWLNTAKYSAPMLLLYGVGCTLWAVAYMGTLAKIRSRRYVEIPAAAVVANVAWELVWSFIYHPDVGRLFAWGYGLWFFLDVFITYNLFKYGPKQIVNPTLRRWFAPAAAFGIAAWTVMLYFFVKGGYDSPYGGISGYILNVMMSALYIVLIVQQKDDLGNFSALVGWSKMLGTGLLSVFNAILVPENGFLMTLCAVTFLLDATYIVTYHVLAARQRSTAPAAGVVRAPRTV
jgi:hypothetical protein